MHPRTHLLVSTLAAGVLAPRLGPVVLLAWATGFLADVDHIAWHAYHARRLDVFAAWRHFAGDGREPRPAGYLPLHAWPLILGGLLAGAGCRPVGLLAAGLAGHRLLDDLARVTLSRRARATRRKAAVHAALFRRAGYACEHCGASGVCLEPHHRVSRASGGPDALPNLVALCVVCHRQAHHPTG